MVLAIAKSIFAESKYAAELLLKVEKVKFKNTLKRLNRNTLDIDDEGNQEARGEFKEIIADHLRNIERLDSERSFLVSERKKGLINRPKKHTILERKIDGSVHVQTTYSTMVNFPTFKMRQLSIWLIIILLVVNSTSIANYFYLSKFYKTLDAGLDTSAKLNLASSSVFVASGILYARIVMATDNVPSPFNRINALEIYPRLKGYIISARDESNRLLQQNFGNMTVCNTAIQDIYLPKNESIYTQEEICLYSTNDYEDTLWLKGVSDVLTTYNRIEQELAETTAVNTTFDGFFSGERYYKHDLQVFYLTVMLRRVSTGFMEIILEHIDYSNKVSTWLTWCFVGSVIVFWLIYVFWWIRRQLQMWEDIKCVFLVLNDETLNNMYIKAFFGYEMET